MLIKYKTDGTILSFSGFDSNMSKTKIDELHFTDPLNVDERELRIYDFNLVSDIWTAKRNNQILEIIDGSIAIYPLIQLVVDKQQIIADGIDTATITATVETDETIELYQVVEDGTETLVTSENTVAGVATFEVTMAQPGVLNLVVKSTTKYGQANATIEGV